MPFVPHTDEEVKAMLQSIGVSSIDALFDEIPKALRIKELKEIPEGLNEMAVKRLLQERANKDLYALNFIGAGAYEHHIPAAVWDIASRGEWLTAYTPYQAEASQGTLQLLYEYQTMMANLCAMEVSNASLYDGASALAEAILMAVRLSGGEKNRDKDKQVDKQIDKQYDQENDKQKGSARHQILLPKTLHPAYRQVVMSILKPHADTLTLKEIPYDTTSGQISLKALHDLTDPNSVIALVIPQPNFFGVIEDVDTLTDWAQKFGIKIIGVVNPIAMALLKPPGEWGTNRIGADIACGEGQPLGVPMASGGPYFGFLCCKKEYIRQLPGRLIGRTKDANGKIGYTLTLQAREQHIRRAKATSNICTNQGLLVTAATVYMSLLGPEGLLRVARASADNMAFLVENVLRILQIDGVKNVLQVFEGPFFHECVLSFPNINDAEQILNYLSKKDILGGFNLKPYYPELGASVLICTTETKTKADILAFCEELKNAVQQLLVKKQGAASVC